MYKYEKNNKWSKFFLLNQLYLDFKNFLSLLPGKYYFCARYLVRKVALYPFNYFACINHDCHMQLTIKNAQIKLNMQIDVRTHSKVKSK